MHPKIKAAKRDNKFFLFILIQDYEVMRNVRTREKRGPGGRFCHESGHKTSPVATSIAELITRQVMPGRIVHQGAHSVLLFGLVRS